MSMRKTAWVKTWGIRTLAVSHPGSSRGGLPPCWWSGSQWGACPACPVPRPGLELRNQSRTGDGTRASRALPHILSVNSSPQDCHSLGPTYISNIYKRESEQTQHMNQWEQANTLNESQIINGFHTTIDHFYLIFANCVKRFDKRREKCCSRKSDN